MKEKTVVYEYQNEQEVVMKVKELELQGVRHDDIYVLAHEKHITKKGLRMIQTQIRLE